SIDSASADRPTVRVPLGPDDAGLADVGLLGVRLPPEDEFGGAGPQAARSRTTATSGDRILDGRTPRSARRVGSTVGLVIAPRHLDAGSGAGPNRRGRIPNGRAAPRPSSIRTLTVGSVLVAVMWQPSDLLAPVQ